MNAEIILGCEGRQDDGFVYCNGVKNVIIDLEKLRNSSRYLELIKYLDKVVKIFDGPCVKPHVITNAIYKLHEMGYIDEDKHNRIANFYKVHRPCGLVMWAVPKISYRRD